MTPPQPSPNTSTDTTPQLSRSALFAFLIGLLALPLFFLLLPAAIAIILGTLAAYRIHHPPSQRSGLGYARAGVILGVISIAIPIVLTFLSPFLQNAHRKGSSSYCAANLRGIVQSMNIYAADHNNTFPIVPYAPYSPALNTVSGTAITTDADATIKSLYAPDSSQHGSPTTSLWILVLRNQASPIQFRCKSDPWARRGAAPTQDPTGNFFNTFQHPQQLSYSATYPYKSDGTVGKWWTALNDATLPIMSDMAPEHGTGTPTRILNPATAPRDPKTWNSDNHKGEGQSVAFSDVHVEWTRKPTVGQMNDNIWTFGSPTDIGPIEFGGLVPTRAPITLRPATSAPFDIVMVPFRNATTGKL